MFRLLANVGSRVLASACQVSSQFTVKPSLIGLQPALELTTPQTVQCNQVRTVIKYSMSTGKRKTVHAVVKRFYRLNWGIWIRTKAGRYRRLWSKTPTNRRQLREHVFCNATQSKMLDRMVSEFWRRPKHYIDDPYAPYHSREEFWITRRKPWRPEGWE